MTLERVVLATLSKLQSLVLLPQKVPSPQIVQTNRPSSPETLPYRGLINPTRINPTPLWSWNKPQKSSKRCLAGLSQHHGSRESWNGLTDPAEFDGEI